MEYVDVLTPDGVRTGVRKPKPDVHRDGDWHLAAHLWIFTPNDRVLLQLRAEAKDNWPGWWDVSVAGHVSAGEEALAAVLRECEEELGLAVDAARVERAGVLREQCVLDDGAYVDNELHEIFLSVREIDLATLRLDPEEVADVALVTLDEVRNYRVVPSSLRSLEQCVTLRGNR